MSDQSQLGNLSVVKVLSTSGVWDLGIKLILKKKLVFSTWFSDRAMVDWIMAHNDIQTLVSGTCEY